MSNEPFAREAQEEENLRIYLDRTPTLRDWAQKHGISGEAIIELRQTLGAHGDVKGIEGRNEASIQNDVRMEASEKGLRLWRNNVGACMTAEGAMVRYGLCNESKKVNAVMKSSDLIGIRPVTIEQHHVGTVVGQFVAREVKRAGWKYSGNKHEQAQLNWLALIESLGGDACFCAEKGSL